MSSFGRGRPASKRRRQSTVQPSIEKYLIDLKKVADMDGVHDDDAISVVEYFDPDDPTVHAAWEQAQAVAQG